MRISDWSSDVCSSDLGAVGLTEYSTALNPFLVTAYAPASYPDTLGETLAKAGKTQLRIAETEKYAHVTFFMNGGEEQPFDGEDRILEIGTATCRARRWKYV